MNTKEYWDIIDNLKTNNIKDRYSELAELLKNRNGKDLFHFKFITDNLKRKLLLCDFKEIIHFLYKVEFTEEVINRFDEELFSHALGNTILMGSLFYGQIIANPQKVTKEEKLSLKYSGDYLNLIVDEVIQGTFDYLEDSRAYVQCSR